MNIFLGCDPEALETLSETIGERALELVELGEKLRDIARSTDWAGPDAEKHRLSTDWAYEALARMETKLRQRSDELRHEANQQEAASAAEADAVPPLPPWVVGEEGSWPALPPLQGRGPLQNPGPWIGGPFQHPAFPASRARDPLPEGEEFALAPGRYESAEQVRRYAFSAHPYTALGQAVMDVHEHWGTGLDMAEAALEERGLGKLTPLIDLARVPHATSSLLIGERSPVGQVVSSAEHLWANTEQTAAEVTDAIGQGDLGGAVRAGERGLYRHRDGVARLLLAPSFALVPETAADVLGHGADAVETFSPRLAEPLRQAEQGTRAVADGVQEAREDFLDSEDWYDARRRVMPMPWDPR